jgi:RsiW-degrading membrane proteinase PrsW (M82 family)
MTFLAYLVLGFAPGLFWLWWFHRKDDLEPEPRSRVIFVFLLGCASTAVVLAVHELLPVLPASWSDMKRELVDMFVTTALVEELAKLGAFLAGAWFSRDLDEPLDGIIYGIAAALGFASVENVFYVVRFDDPGVAVQRAFTATLAHVVFTGSMGFFFGVAKFREGAVRGGLMAAGLAVAVVLHGLYDLFLLPGRRGLSLLSILGLVPLGLLLLALKIRWARARSPEYHPWLARRRLRRGARNRRSRNPGPPRT